MKCRIFLVLGLTLAASIDLPVAMAADSSPATTEAEAPDHLKKPMANPEEDPSLPNVLLLGDSISIGYTVPVRRLLAGKANVFRPPTNCSYSSNGVAKVKSWLGTRRWDVIHFNWGIWDTHYLRGGKLVRVSDEAKAEATFAPGEMRIRSTETQYVHNLEQILAILEETGAKLIWANTTPIMSRKGERFEHIAQYNRAAAKLMTKRDIEIDDLYRFVLPHAADWQSKDQVHYNEVGREKLGEKVAQCVEKALANETPAESESQLVR